MYSPHKFSGRVGDIGQPLPDTFKQLGDNRAKFRRGATSLVAGTPGSVQVVSLALNMLTSWADQGIKSLYFAADSDEMTVATRLSGILTGDSFDTIERRMMTNDRRKYEDALTKRLAGKAEFEYEQMEFDDIVRHVKSFEAAYGAYPDVIFLDNQIDFVETTTDYGGMIELIRDMDGLSKEIKSHVCILHHAKLRDNKHEQDSDDYDPNRPPSEWEVVGRITQLPRLVLTVCAVGMNVNMAVVKNTLGPSSKDASHVLGFTVYSSMQVSERAFMSASGTERT